MEENLVQTIKDSFTLLPEEARSFLYKGPYSEAVSTIATKFSLSLEQQEVFSGIVLGYITQGDDFTDLEEKLSLLELSQEQKDSLLVETTKLILQPLLSYVESEIGEEETEKEESVAPTPTDVLASLKARLTTPGAIAPVSRELPAAPTEKPASPKPAIDPYRELPN